MKTSHGVPRAPRGFVPSERLYALLDDLPPLTIVRAPAGFGKTALVASWIRDRLPSEYVAAWLTVRPPDGAGDTFWRRIHDALSDAGASGRNSRTVRSHDQVDRFLRRAPQPVVLVIDGYEAVEDLEVDDDLIDLVRRHDRLHLIVCLRDGRRFDLQKWLYNDGELISAADLMLTSEQVAELFARLGVPEPTRLALDLAPALGGWATAVRSVAVGLRDSEAAGANVSAALARTRDRLGSVLVGQFDRSTAEHVLFPAALLGTFSLEELACLVPDEASSTAAMRRLVHSGLVLADDDNPVPRYQWPAFAQSAVIDELGRRYPTRERALRIEIARHLEARDRIPEAFAHAVQAEDWDLVATMVDHEWSSLYMDDRAALAAAADRAPDDLARSTISLMALRALFSPEATADAALARATLPGDPDALRRLAKGPMVITAASIAQLVLVTLRVSGRFPEAGQQADRMMQLLRSVPHAKRQVIAPRIGGWALQCGITYLHAGRLDDAVVALELAHRRGPDAPVPYVCADAAAKLALTHCLRGAFSYAAEWITRADQTPAPDVWAGPYIQSTLAAARALFAVATLDRDAAVAASAELSAHSTRQLAWPLVLHARARVALHWGDRVGLAHELSECRRAPSRRPAVRSSSIQRLLLCDEVDLAMALGAGSRAHALLESGGTSARLDIRRGWLALRSGRPVEAASRSAAALTAGEGNAEDDVAALLLAMSAARDSDDARAMKRWARLAGKRIEGSGCLAPLHLLTPAERVTLLDEVPDLPTTMPERDSTVLAERLTVITLTERERAILEHLAAGWSFADIAQSDFVSLNTLKAQSRSLYRKLGARDRVEALRIAQAEGVL